MASMGSGAIPASAPERSARLGRPAPSGFLSRTIGTPFCRAPARRRSWRQRAPPDQPPAAVLEAGRTGSAVDQAPERAGSCRRAALRRRLDGWRPPFACCPACNTPRLKPEGGDNTTPHPRRTARLYSSALLELHTEVDETISPSARAPKDSEHARLVAAGQPGVACFVDAGEPVGSGKADSCAPSGAYGRGFRCV
eukprot:scaffold16722_cov78-Phaeocystis_antarctica.AAC.3